MPEKEIRSEDNPMSRHPVGMRMPMHMGVKPLVWSGDLVRLTNSAE